MHPASNGCSFASGVGATLFNEVPIHDLDRGTLVAAILRMRRCGHAHVVHFLAADPLTIARRSPPFARVLQRADLNIADGLPVVWALRATGGHATRITASDGLALVCAEGIAAGLKHYFYGAEEGTLARLVPRLKATHPGLRVVGAHAPPYRPLEAFEVGADAARIREAGPDVVWVGLGAPKQNFVAEALREEEAAPVVITIGAAFDFASGVKRRAPAWMRQVGLEWLFRMLQEPRRLGRRYVVGNTRFALDVARAIWLRRHGQMLHRSTQDSAK